MSERCGSIIWGVCIFAIVQGRSKFLDEKTPGRIMIAAIITHNTVVEDEHSHDVPCAYDCMARRV
jgi:hypothetical protein